MVEFVELTGQVLILWIGAYTVIKGNMTIGQVIAYNSLLTYSLDSMKNLINLQPQMQTAMVASEHLGEILDLEIEKTVNEQNKLRSIFIRRLHRI